MNHLPQELNYNIFSFISPHKLLTLSQINKHFYELIHKLDHIIYKHIDLAITPDFLNYIKIYDGFTNMGIDNFGFAERVKYVESLVAWGCYNSYNNLTNLTSLSITNGVNLDFEKLSKLEHLEIKDEFDFRKAFNLKSLIIGYDYESCYYEDDFKDLTNLTSLDFGENGYDGSSKVLTNLRSLSIDGQLVDDELQLLTNLTELKLHNFRFVDVHFLNKLTNLKILTLINPSDTFCLRDVTNSINLHIESESYIDVSQFTHLANLTYNGPKEPVRRMTHKAISSKPALNDHL
jgi:hypothetical protein